MGFWYSRQHVVVEGSLEGIFGLHLLSLAPVFAILSFLIVCSMMLALVTLVLALALFRRGL